ncbi:MAG: DUF2141 domain-containing protein [Candidatus Brocadiae bacterium]|nr:DUF2141 domain-containing protein [Candidatus Brocadiia bacterium]
MKKSLLLLTIYAIFCCAFILSQETAPAAEAKSFKITGSISFTGKGHIYLQLVNKEGFDDEKAEKAFSKNMIIKLSELSEENLKAKKAPFAFKKVPAGTYSIKAYQDENANEIFDIGTFGPKEPWGMYRPSRPFMRKPTFQDTYFEIKEDLLDITFIVK